MSYHTIISSREPMRKLMNQMYLSIKLFQLTMLIQVNQNTTKKQLELPVKAVDNIIDKFDLENELLNLID